MRRQPRPRLPSMPRLRPTQTRRPPRSTPPPTRAKPHVSVQRIAEAKAARRAGRRIEASQSRKPRRQERSAARAKAIRTRRRRSTRQPRRRYAGRTGTRCGCSQDPRRCGEGQGGDGDAKPAKSDAERESKGRCAGAKAARRRKGRRRMRKPLRRIRCRREGRREIARRPLAPTPMRPPTRGHAAQRVKAAADAKGAAVAAVVADRRRTAEGCAKHRQTADAGRATSDARHRPVAQAARSPTQSPPPIAPRRPRRSACRTLDGGHQTATPRQWLEAAADAPARAAAPSVVPPKAAADAAMTAAVAEPLITEARGVRRRSPRRSSRADGVRVGDATSRRAHAGPIRPIRAHIAQPRNISRSASPTPGQVETDSLTVDDEQWPRGREAQCSSPRSRHRRRCARRRSSARPIVQAVTRPRGHGRRERDPDVVDRGRTVRRSPDPLRPRRSSPRRRPRPS